MRKEGRRSIVDDFSSVNCDANHDAKNLWRGYISTSRKCTECLNIQFREKSPSPPPSFSFSLVIFEINYFIDLPWNSRRSPTETVSFDPSLMCVCWFFLFISHISPLRCSQPATRFRIDRALSPAAGLHYSSLKVSPNSISASIRETRVASSSFSRRGHVKSKKPAPVVSIGPIVKRMCHRVRPSPLFSSDSKWV